MKNNFCDLHIHCNPDIYKRRYDINDISKELKTSNSIGVLKSHFKSTIELVNNSKDHISNIYGSIVLNENICSINYEKIKNIITNNCNSKFIIHFPTICEHNYKSFMLKSSKVSFNHSIQIYKNNSLNEEIIKIIELASKFNIPLTTGHLRKDEILLVIEQVKKYNAKLLLTHPFHKSIGFTEEEINNLINNSNIYIELTILMNIMKQQTMEDVNKIIKTIDINKICLSSDLGQQNNISVTKGYYNYLNTLKTKFNVNNITLKKISYLNPKKFLGIE